ncbi:phage holin family protein [Chitinophaga sp.]|uniref:phage holin family protein n=1 Tax=Chitinophaga sp. TaxID=1869181 RepID=UPI0031CFE453
MNFLIRLLISALAALITAKVLPGVHINSFTTAIVLAIVLAILNLLVKPILILLTLPVTVLTLGLFLLVINALIIMIASSLVRGFKVDGFIWALLFSLVLTVVTGIMNSLAGTGNDD